VSTCCQSILANCGPDGAPSGDDSLNDSQIVISSSDSSVSNENNGSDNNDTEVKYYGSQIGPNGPPPVIDAEMTQASDPQKRPISDSSDEASDPSPLDPVTLVSSKKSKKNGHLPASVADAARLASQVLDKK